MTVKMMLKNSFDMRIIRRRARKKLRVKHGVKIKLSEVDKIWKDYVNLAIIKPLIKFGKVQIDKNTSIEIVGKKTLKIINLKKGGKASTSNVNSRRPGLTYKVVYFDSNYKRGALVFTASPIIKKSVNEALLNTNIYYRITA